MSAIERRLSSRLAQLIHEGELVHGTLLYRERRCGNPRCKCTQGQRHPTFYLKQNRRGHHRQIYIPRSLERHTRRCIERYQQVRELLEQLSELYWQRLRHRDVEVETE
jgi:hypothetical protein